MKKTYESPEINVVKLDLSDVLLFSSILDKGSLGVKDWDDLIPWN